MAKKLNLQPDEDFSLLGIVSQEKDYRLCFEINRKLGTEFKKADDLEITPVKQKEPSVFSRYEQEENEDGLVYYLLSNKGSAGLLIPEQKPMDYFLMLKGNFFDSDKEEMIRQLRQVPAIRGVYEIEVGKLKSKQNLMF